MKNNFISFNRLHTIIMVAALFSPVFAKTQDIVSARNEYECRVNKNMITKLTKQLSVINVDLAACLTPQEMEDKNKEIMLVRSMKNPDNFQWSRFAEIAAKNNFKLKNCDESPQATFQCVSDLEKRIKSRIDKALTLDQTELLDKKNETEKQLATYRNNIITLRCDPPVEKERTPDIHGTWRSNKDVIYTIIQTASVFTWTTSELHEKGEGTIDGINISVKWSGDRGAGSTSGIVILIDETGKATKIEWNNGLIFTRN